VQGDGDDEVIGDEQRLYADSAREAGGQRRGRRRNGGADDPRISEGRGMNNI